MAHKLFFIALDIYQKYPIEFRSTSSGDSSRKPLIAEAVKTVKSGDEEFLASIVESLQFCKRFEKQKSTPQENSSIIGFSGPRSNIQYFVKNLLKPFKS